MIPFEASGNTAAGFENNYDDCSDESDSPDVVYSITPSTDINVSISTCYSFLIQRSMSMKMILYGCCMQ